MNTQARITAVTRQNDAAGKFQTNLTPVTTLSGKDLVERWAAYSRLNSAVAEATLTMLEGFILAELAEGKKLDFNLVSFYLYAMRPRQQLPRRPRQPQNTGGRLTRFRFGNPRRTPQDDA